MDTTDAVEYASWIRRLVAVAVDLVVVEAVPFVLAFAAFSWAGRDADDGLYGALDRFVLFMLGAIVSSVLLPVTYFAVLVGKSGQTLGKRLCGIAVRDARDARKGIGYGRALMRVSVLGVLWWFYLVPGVLDALWPLRDRRRQSWHDKVASSIVIRP